MKKRLGILSAILVLALTLAVVFAMLASAETVVEAKLVLTPAGGTAETFTGSYDEMAEKMKTSMSSLDGGSAVLTLTADATATKSLVIPGTGAETVHGA